MHSVVMSETAPSGFDKEILKIIKFNQLMGKNLHDSEQMALQLVMLSDGLHEAAVEVIARNNENLRSELCDIVIVATGAAYMAGWFDNYHLNPVMNGELVDVGSSVHETVTAFSRHEQWSELAYSSLSVLEAVMGYCESEGFPLVEDLKKVNDKNLGKFYGSESAANEAAVVFRVTFGVKTDVVKTGDDVHQYALYSSSLNSPDVLKKYPAGKLMKNINQFKLTSAVAA